MRRVPDADHAGVGATIMDSSTLLSLANLQEQWPPASARLREVA